MANYATLKASIAEAIQTNGNQEITGAVLQSVLLSMCSVIGANMQFAGVATTSTAFSTPDQNLWWLATTAGTYTNFGFTIGEGEIHIFTYSDGILADHTIAAFVDGFADSDYSQLENGTIYVLTKSGAAIIPMTSFDAVYNVDSGTNLTSVLASLNNTLETIQNSVSTNANNITTNANHIETLSQSLNDLGTALSGLALSVVADATITPGASNIQIALVNPSGTTIATETIPAATTSAAGAMTAEDKTNLYTNVVKNLIVSAGENIVTVTSKNINGSVIESVNIPAATTSTAGVMTAEDKTNLNTLVDERLWYGVSFTGSSPSCTRIGNLELHKSLPIQSKMRGCLLDDEGKVYKYLDKDTWEDETRDGSKGQVMVEIPEFYGKFEEVNSVYYLKLSTVSLPGFTHFPKMYISAYQAALDRTNLKLCSIINTDTQYRGGNNNSGYDGEANSLLGRPVTNISRTNFRTYARNRNTNITEWNIMTYMAQKTLYWFFIVEYATLNTQLDFNAQLTSEGYHQGGLGAGVSTLSSTVWSGFNGNNPFIPCGYTDAYGNDSGVLDYAITYDDTEYTVSVPRYRGVENPFAHIWQWTDGVNVEVQSDDDGGVSNVYVCNVPAKFSDSSYEYYNLVGTVPRGNGWAKTAIWGDGGEIIPTAVGGGSTTYFCDYYYTSIPTSTTLRGLLFGGNAAFGANCGFAAANPGSAPSAAGTGVGSRLCFIPA